MLHISDFNVPEQHPYGMLEGYSCASEKESILALLLTWCHTEKDLYTPYEFIHDHSSMVEDGLLEHVDGTTYRLTTKSIGLLYSVYGKSE